MLVNGAVALITGGARGFGKAFSEALLKRGCKVCFADTNVTEGKKTEQEFKRTYGHDAVLFVKCDVTSDAEFKDLFKAAIRQFSTIDIVVNNAGILNEELWEKTLAINLTGTVRGTLLAVEHMRKDKGGKGGIIINVGSSGGLYPTFFQPTYAASKFGVVGLTRSWADNPLNKTLGLSFACICPAFSETRMLDILLEERPPLLFSEEAKVIIKKGIDKLGINSVDDIATAFIELVEKDNCNGDVVTVNKLRGPKYRFTLNKNKL